MNAAQRREAYFGEIEGVEVYLERARARAERAAKELRKSGAEDHLVEAVERTQEELSELARQLRQGTYFAVPSAQTSL